MIITFIIIKVIIQQVVFFEPYIPSRPFVTRWQAWWASWGNVSAHTELVHLVMLERCGLMLPPALTCSLPHPLSDLCHHRRDLHCGGHSGLVHLHSLRGLEEDPAGQDALTSCPANGRAPRETTCPAPAPCLPLPSGLGSGCIPKCVWEVGGQGWLGFLSYLFFPMFNFR